MKSCFCLLATFILPLSYAEDLKFSPDLDGWSRSAKGAVSVEAGEQAGENTVRLEDGAQILKKLELAPDSEYEIHFSVKGENIQAGENSGARIMLNSGKTWMRITSRPGNLPEVGTFDWREGIGTINTGNLIGEEIHLYLGISGAGTVWFKNISISPKDKSPTIGALKFDTALSGWNFTGKGNVDVDSQIKISDRSVRLEGNSGICRSLRLEPDTRYELSFYIKGKDIATGSNSGARIMLNSGKTWGRITTQPSNSPETGTFDWKRGTGVIDTGKFKSGDVTIYLSLNGEGTVWFDGLEIKKVVPAQKSDLSYRIELFPANFENNKVSFCENLPGLLEIVSSGKGNYSGKTAKMFLDLPDFISLVGVCENFTLIRDGKLQRVPCEIKKDQILRNEQQFTRYEITFNREFLSWINANWYRHIIFLEQKTGSAGKQGTFYWSFAIGDEKQPEQSVSVKILDAVRYPETPCKKFCLWLSSSLAAKSPFFHLGLKSLNFWQSLATQRFRTARRYRDSFINYPGFIPFVTANGTNFLSNQDYDDGQMAKDFYEKMPKDVTEKGTINPRRYSSVWALVDDPDGLYDQYLRMTLRNLKKIYPEMKHLWWDFEPFVYGYDEGGRARFANKIGLKGVPSIEDIKKYHAETYFQYMVNLHAALIEKNAKIVREELPGVKFWLCSDNLHAAEPHVARWCGVDVSLSDSCIDGHMHMPYYTGLRYFDDTAYNIGKLKKPYFPLIDPAERILSFYRQYSPQKVRQNILATAALGGVGIGIYPDDLLAGEYYHVIAESFSTVAKAEDFYFEGKRIDKDFSVVAKNAVSRNLPDGETLTFPDFSRTIRYTAHEKDGKYLITVFNYDSKQPLIAEIFGKDFAPVLVKVQPDGCEIIGTDIVPNQKALQDEIAVFSGKSDIFKDYQREHLSAVWSADNDGKPLLRLSDGTISAGVDALNNNEVVSLLTPEKSELLTDGFAGQIQFADKLQPPVHFRHVKHGISDDGCPFVIAEAQIAPYEGANPEPNPLYQMKIERKIEIRNGKLLIVTQFFNPTNQAMPLICRLKNYPWPGNRFQADKVVLADTYDEKYAQGLWLRKPDWKNVPVDLIGSSRVLHEKITFIPDEKFDGLYSWTLQGKMPRKTVEFLVETPLPAKQSLTYQYTIEISR